MSKSGYAISLFLLLRQYRREAGRAYMYRADRSIDQEFQRCSAVPQCKEPVHIYARAAWLNSRIAAIMARDLNTNWLCSRLLSSGHKVVMELRRTILIKS